MRHWFKDHSMRGLLKNSSYLAASQAVASICSVLSVAFVGRTLGLAMFGILVLVTSYVDAVNDLIKFQSWQLVVRYGGGVLSGRAHDFREATCFALGLDLLSGFGGMVVAMAILPLVNTMFGIPHRYLADALLYCTVLPTMTAAAPGGVLQCFNRFDLLGIQQTIEPISRALLTGIAWAVHAPLEVFLLIWWATSFISDLFIWLIAARELQRHKLLRGLYPILRPRTLIGAWRFAIHVNLNQALIAASGPVMRLIVGSSFASVGAALYRAALSVADAIKQPANLLLKVYYPHLAEMDLKTKAPWRLMARVSIFTGAFGLFAAVVLGLEGKPILAAVFGEHFVPAYSAMMVLSISPVLGMIGFAATPMLYALHRPDVPVRSRLGGTVIQFVVVGPFIHFWGLIGVAAAVVLGETLSIGGMAIRLRREHRKLERNPAGPC